MKKERVLAKRRATHQLQFVRSDLAQVVFQPVAPPLFGVHDHAKVHTAHVEPKLLELSEFSWRVNKRIVARGHKRIRRAA